MNIDFPFYFDSRGRTATTNDNDHIRNLIEQFLFTNPGERVNRPEFGSGLLGMVFEPNSPEYGAFLQQGISAGLQRWLGDLIEVRALRVSSDEATLRVVLQYTLRPSGETRTETFQKSMAP